MNLYLISRPNEADWDQFRHAVVVAPDEESARLIHPSPRLIDKWPLDNWVEPEEVVVKLIGTAHPDYNEGDVLCRDYQNG